MWTLVLFSDPHSGLCTCTGTCMGPSEGYRKKGYVPVLCFRQFLDVEETAS